MRFFRVQKNEIKKFACVYPISFMIILVVILGSRTREADYDIIEDETIPLGVIDLSWTAPADWPAGEEMLLEKCVTINDQAHKIVYEQATGLYLVYRGYTFIGCLQMPDGQSLRSIDETNLLDRIVPYGS